MRNLFIAATFLLTLTCCKNNQKSSEPKSETIATETRKASNETEENIYKDADSMMSAFKQRDWKTFVRFNNPAMVKMMRGADEFEKVVNEQMKDIPDTSITQMEAGKILQVIKTPTDQQCVIEQVMQMNMNGYKIISTNYLIGESLDGGRNWTFFDGSDGGNIKPSTIKPNLSPSLVIPERKQDAQKL